MEYEHLKDISKRPDFKEITSRGGKAKTKKKEDAKIYTVSKRTKCKNCKIRCQFRNVQMEKDPESVCIVPAMRAEAIKNGTKIVEWDDDRIRSYINDLLALYRDILFKTVEDNPKKIKREWIKDLNTMFKRVVEFKEKFYPETQKNVNLNIDFNSRLQEWRKERKKIFEIEKRVEERGNDDEQE